MLLFESMHPKFRLKMAKSLSLPKGSAVVNFEATYPPLPIPLKCNYEVVTEWAGKFPSTVKVTIDLTPMRDKLYKVKPTQDNE